ncbi:hypothetical protein PACTADRAFT_20853, partial [Pachysolen tannophilus NRRL Y-2460]
MDQPFNSRRSVVYSAKGIASSSQPLASQAGIKILAKGGNCVDACIAISACLCVLEPASTGIGGDCFALYYDNKDKKVYGLNGTGRSASELSLDYIKSNFPDHILPTYRLKKGSIFMVNVPGAIAGWCDAFEKWGSGKVTLEECLQPAIELAEKGAPISQISAHLWAASELNLKIQNKNADQTYIDDLSIFLPNPGFKAPLKGQFLKNEKLAETLKLIAKNGKAGFYQGSTAEAIVEEVRSRGGLISLQDLENHTSTFVEPISLQFGEQKLWEIPPNGQGLVALLALGLIRELSKTDKLDLSTVKHNSVEYLHLLIESLKLSFRDSDEYVNDPDFYKLLDKNAHSQEDAIEKLLEPEYLQERIKSISKEKVIDNETIKHGVPNSIFKSDTVYFTATDSEGNACSFINSLYESFGSGIIVPDKGFVLHNRGGNFSCKPNSKNCIAGNKRCYHTIIPGMITTPSSAGSEDLYASYGIMGGFNQPQAHVQVFLNLTLFGFDPQVALDAPRITLLPHPSKKHLDKGHGSDGPTSNPVTLVCLEEGIDDSVVEGLNKLGHDVKVLKGNQRSAFGRGQIVKRCNGSIEEYKDVLVWAGGCDLRSDGASIPFI